MENNSRLWRWLIASLMLCVIISWSLSGIYNSESLGISGWFKALLYYSDVVLNIGTAFLILAIYELRIENPEYNHDIFILTTYIIQKYILVVFMYITAIFGLYELPVILLAFYTILHMYRENHSISISNVSDDLRGYNQFKNFFGYVVDGNKCYFEFDFCNKSRLIQSRFFIIIDTSPTFDTALRIFLNMYNWLHPNIHNYYVNSHLFAKRYYTHNKKFHRLKTAETIEGIHIDITSGVNLAENDVDKLYNVILGVEYYDTSCNKKEYELLTRYTNSSHSVESEYSKYIMEFAEIVVME